MLGLLLPGIVNRPSFVDVCRLIGEGSARGLVLAAQDYGVQNDAFLSGVTVSANVLPNPATMKYLSWGEVRRLVRKEVRRGERVSQAAVHELLATRDATRFAEGAEELWPWRSPKDKGLSRTRLLDVVRIARAMKEEDLIKDVLCEMPVGMDQCTVRGSVWYSLVYGREWFENQRSLGLWDVDLAHLQQVLKVTNDTLKARGGMKDENWRRYCECNGLVGYRNPPFPGFDLMSEAESLAAGGNVRTTYGRTWSELCRKFLKMPYRKVDFVKFDDYITSAKWLTTGASSVGYLELTLSDGTKKKVKARKNMVLDVIDMAELVAKAKEWKQQDNVVLLKSELGKLRLAVSSDLYTYLQQSWILHLLGGAYNEWPGSTSEESFIQQTQRMWKMLELCRTKVGLPYDFKGFDHQPQTSELVAIVEVLVDHARMAVPTAELANFEVIARNVIAGFWHSTLEVPSYLIEGKAAVTLPVTGGLMSGLRFTSLVGNAWNTVVTGLVIEVVADWGIPREVFDRYIRGDDSAIYSDNWPQAALANIAYTLVGAEAGVGKFSVLGAPAYYSGVRPTGQMEFLRVWYSDRCYGYASRAIPSLAQRKPWSSEPWAAAGVLEALWEGVRTIKRREPKLQERMDKIWNGLKGIWCQLHSLSKDVVWVPREQGGLGIEPPPVGTMGHVWPRIPKVSSVKGAEVDNQNKWRADEIAKYAKERYGLVLGDKAHELAREDLLETLVTDNVPIAAQEARREWKEELRKDKRVVHIKKVPVVELRPTVDLDSYGPGKVRDLMDRLKRDAPWFGSHPEALVARQDFQRFEPDMGFRDWLKRYYPTLAAAEKQFHKSYHISERLDLLAGKMNIRPKVLHPALNEVLSLMVAATLKPRAQSAQGATLWGGSMLENVVLESSLSWKTYRW